MYKNTTNVRNIVSYLCGKSIPFLEKSRNIFEFSEKTVFSISLQVEFFLQICNIRKFVSENFRKL